uniref:R13L1/DRL21-like LRR repeat region domain-containing protein n=2 Tax=Opuntia streptacantha TaxID=393608 RepID=A0A7C9EEI0_OPUST
MALTSVIKDPIHEAKEANLGSKRGLKELKIRWWWGEQGSENSEALLESLKPQPNLKKLTIGSYSGVRLPNWAQMDNLCTSLPYLVDIHLSWFHRCQQVPTFCHLRFLKRLQLKGFPEVEYMESGDPLREVCSLREEALFFPSLQELTLMDMNNLKGWWKVMGEVVSNGQKEELVQLPKLQHLSKLEIKYCRKMMSMPLCPNLEELTLVGVNETLSVF